MPSIVPGYEYDIFISYRQKDNRGDHWVSEFVQVLQAELDATFKEDISIYFDENPHDGLLETENVDKSLEGKLKCLIFIPIVSQTYCDVKSYAWQHEFCAFNKLVKDDQLGSDVKLINGNVASRILPIKIHDLDAGDVATFESETGGVLRAIDFIYKSAGVNRPLRITEDRPHDNLNKTHYRDQINKVARAIKDRISGIQQLSDSPAKRLKTNQPVARPNVRRLGLMAGIIVLVGALGFAGYYFIRGGNNYSPVDRSIAVLPFINISNDPDQEYFSDGLTEELLNVLTKVPDLKVIARTSSFYFKGKNDDVRAIGKKLGVAHVLEGSVRKSGDKIRITAQLIKVDDGVHLWSETYERKIDDIFQIQDEISLAILTNLKSSLQVKSKISYSTDSEVNNLLLQGNYFYEKRDSAGFQRAFQIYKQAVSIDSMDARIWAAIAKCCIPLSLYEGNPKIEQAKIAIHRALKLDDNLPEAHRILGYLKGNDNDYEGAIKEYKKVLELQPANSDAYRNIATEVMATGRLDESINYTKRAIELDPIKASNYWSLAAELVFSGDYDQAISVVNKLIDIQPNFPGIPKILAEIYLLQGKTDLVLSEVEQLDEEDEDFFKVAVYYLQGKKIESEKALAKVVRNHKGDDWAGLAQLYAFLGNKEEALKCIEQAYSSREDLLTTMKVDPFFVSLRSEPRFKAILLKMNLPVD